MAFNDTKRSALRLAADEETAAQEPVAPAPVEAADLDPRVTDFAREHRNELYTSDEDVPTRLRDLKTLVGPVGPHVFYVPEMLSGPDFSATGSVEVANYEGFMKEYEDHPGVYPVVGSHNSFAVAIRLNVMNDTMLQVFEALQEAPTEEAAPVSVTPEAQESAWANWVAGTFEQALIEKFPDFAEMIEEFSDEHLKAMFDSIRKRTGGEWYAEGEDATIDVAKIVEGAIPEDFKNAPAPKDEPKTLEETVNPEPELAEDDAALEPKAAAKKKGFHKFLAIKGSNRCTACDEVASHENHRKKAEKKAAANMDEFTKAYFECALWSSMDNSDPNTGGDPLDKNYSFDDFDEETRTKMVADCQQFQDANGALLVDENLTHPDQWDALQHGGHDFWLTRNGHGAGFWDGDWKKEVGDKLTASAKKFGEYNLYVGDDGKIYAE